MLFHPHDYIWGIKSSIGFLPGKWAGKTKKKRFDAGQYANALYYYSDNSA